MKIWSRKQFGDKHENPKEFTFYLINTNAENSFLPSFFFFLMEAKLLWAQ
jgi:hypothetical protein